MIKLNTLFVWIFVILLFSGLSSCARKKENVMVKENPQTIVVQAESGSAEIVIREFGSSCVPCVKMKIILELIEERADKQLEVIFIDVGTATGEAAAEEYGIKIIPSQIFFDSNGVEFFRHDGYLPEEEIEKVLIEKGVKI